MAQIYKCNADLLEPGDILLTRNSVDTDPMKRLQSKIIQFATRGPFSHAAICTTPPTFIEAIGAGVGNISIQTCYVKDLKNIRLIRHNNKDIAEKAAKFAMSHFAQEYSVVLAIMSVIPSAVWADFPNTGTFCSSLVGVSYKRAGCSEFAQLDPLKITPAGLFDINVFRDITDQSFRKVDEPENLEQMSALDGKRVDNPMRKYGHILTAGFQRFIPILLELHKNYSNEYPLPTGPIGTIAFLEKIMHQNSSNIGNVPHLLHQLDEAIVHLLDSPEAQAALREAVIMDQRALHRLEKEINNNGIETIVQVRQNKNTTIQQIEQRNDVLNQLASTQSLLAFQANTKIIVESMQNRLRILEEIDSDFKAKENQ